MKAMKAGGAITASGAFSAVAEKSGLKAKDVKWRLSESKPSACQQALTFAIKTGAAEEVIAKLRGSCQRKMKFAAQKKAKLEQGLVKRAFSEAREVEAKWKLSEKKNDGSFFGARVDEAPTSRHLY